MHYSIFISMERIAEIYIGNAANFNPENLYTIEGCTVSDSGEVFYNGEKLKKFKRYGYYCVFVPIDGKLRNCKVHRIVATTFRDICGEFNEVVNIWMKIKKITLHIIFNGQRIN